MKTFYRLMMTLSLFVCTNLVSADTIQVNCDTGGTLSQALGQATSGDTIEVRGTCEETVAITTDGLTLVGLEGATLDGGGDTQQPVILIQSSRGVTLRGFTIQNAIAGILVVDSASAIIDSTELRQHSASGVTVSGNATARIINSTMENNGVGVNVIAGGLALFIGVNQVLANERQGILVAYGMINFAFAPIPHELRVLRNGTEGIKFLTGRGTFFGGTVISNENGTDGILLQHNSTVVKGTEGFPSTIGTVTTNQNVGNGIRLESGSDFGSDPNLTTLQSQNNGLAGISLDNSAATIAGATLDANGTADIVLAFQSALTLDGNNTIANVTLDETSLCRDNSEQSLCP